MDLQDFVRERIDTFRADSMINSTDAADEFLSRSLELMESIDEFKDPIPFYFGKPGRRNRPMQIDGYSFDEADKSLILIISDFEDSYSPDNLTNSRVEALYKRMQNFLDEVCMGDLGIYCDDADDALKVGRHIKSRMFKQDDPLLKIRMYILSNRKLSDKVRKLKADEFCNKPVELHLWPIERYFEVSNSFNNEPLVIDIINEFNIDGIPCLRGDIGEDLGYRAYIAIIPGKTLADIYIEHGSRVLEGNIRAFLGASGSKSVNSGIKRTINAEPHNFFTYNNGIAVTASRIELDETMHVPRITKLEDMQIINGGQTTASLAAAVLKKDNPSLDGIYVPMKITVIEDRESVDEDGNNHYDKMVQAISKFANSQNKVTAADFFSNSPFHIIMERMSKRHLAPPVNGSPIPTGWYYERARKKYEQEQIKMTNSQRDTFTRKFPKKQIIKKEELAKYLYTIDCRPDIVSRGSNWTMKEFGESINNAYRTNKEVFNDFFFKKSVTAAIIFRSVDKLVQTSVWYQKGGYKLNIVPYCIAKLISSIPDGYSLDWMRIWQQQTLYPSFIKEIELLAQITNEFIINSNGIIVTEYCKRKETWENYKKMPYRLSDEFINDLIPLNEMNQISVAAQREQREINRIAIEVQVVELGENYWRALLIAARGRGVLSYRDESLLNVAANMETSGRLPSPAQAREIMAIHQRISDEGILI